MKSLAISRAKTAQQNDSSTTVSAAVSGAAASLLPSLSAVEILFVIRLTFGAESSDVDRVIFIP